MRVHVVSDVHGNVDALARAGEGADALLVLGDLIDFVNYHNPSAGILGTVFGPAAVERFAHLRSAGAPGAAFAFARQLWAQLPDARELVRQAVAEQYERLFAVMPDPTYATPGNVDVPELWSHFAHGGVHVLDGQTTEIGGLNWGFVGGGLLPGGVVPQREPVFRSYLRTPEHFAAAVAGLGRVDMLCSHIPPAVPELLYDVQARRPEIGSQHLLSLIWRDRPRAALFGHVHQPLARRVRVGRTECVNVGHFQRTGTPYVVRY
ncbi:MAG TPA: metallophosphoesterase [Pseudonocardiaceae bacterium]|nr:metallophosphoesterase [Pseudonocardiaceae bacterium]